MKHLVCLSLVLHLSYCLLMSILLQNQNRLPTYTESRWNQYIEEAPSEIHDEFPQPEDDMYTTDGSVFHRSKKRKRNTSR